jgi:hypothetical protein
LADDGDDLLKKLLPECCVHAHYGRSFCDTSAATRYRHDGCAARV